MMLCFALLFFLFIIIYKLFAKRKENPTLTHQLLKSCICECLKILYMLELNKILEYKSKKIFTNLILLYHKEIYKEYIFDQINSLFVNSNIQLENVFGNILLEFIKVIKFEQTKNKDLELILDEKDFPEYLLKSKIIYEIFITHKIKVENSMKYHIIFPVFTCKKNCKDTFLNYKLANSSNKDFESHEVILPDTIIMILTNEVWAKEIFNCYELKIYNHDYIFFCAGIRNKEKAKLITEFNHILLEKNSKLSFIILKRKFLD